MAVVYEWSQREEEPDKWYGFFLVWRDHVHPRPTWKKFAQTHKLNYATLRNMSTKWEWRARSIEWDNLRLQTPEQRFDATVSARANAKVIEPAADLLAAARLKRVELVAAATDLALEGIKAISPDMLKPADAVALARLVLGFDQQALTINVGDTSVTIDRAALDDLSPEEARRIIEGDIVGD